jgi:hypothetical protein
MAPLRGKFLFLYIITLISVTKIHSNSPVSGSCSCSYGSYPGPFCHATNVILNHTSRTFIIPTADPLPSGTGATFTVWPVSTQEVPRPPLCDRTLKEALFFTFFYWYGHSNYFHLHYDTLIPVYKYVRDRRGKAGETHRLTLMPTVETSRLKVMNWDTDAFHEKNLNKYFVLVHKVVSKSKADNTDFSPKFVFFYRLLLVMNLTLFLLILICLRPIQMDLLVLRQHTLGYM